LVRGSIFEGSLAERPEDVVMELQCVLIQRNAERRPVSFLRLTLLDLEIVDENEVLPGVFRRVARLPHVTTRLTLFRILSLEELFHKHEDECHLWHNNILVDLDVVKV